jgi:nicotinamidase-related amidase
MVAAKKVSRSEVLLVLIDMQERLADVMPRRDAVIASAVLLARVAAALGIPAIVTRQYPRGLGETAPELAEALGGLVPIDKTAFSCMGEPVFRERLDVLARRQVLLTGMETHICVTQTALDLLAEGYDVYVVADATCSRRDADRDAAFERLRGAGATVLTAESAIYEVLGEADTPEFRQVLPLVKAHDPGGPA